MYEDSQIQDEHLFAPVKVTFQVPHEFLITSIHNFNQIHKNTGYCVFTSISVYGLSRKNLGNIRIPIPTIGEQQKIASILSRVDAYIQKNQEYKKKLERLKKGLMQKLLTGQIRVKI